MTAAPLTRANGATHPPAPPSVPRLPRGPACPWPPGDSAADTTPNADTLTAELAPVAASTVSRFVSRLRIPDGDRVITWSMTAVVSAVILFAAIVSYTHVHSLAAAHKEDAVQSHLLPLSLDGVIAEASLVKLYWARHRVARKPRLATSMLWTGIVATLAANALVALPASWISAVANAVIGAVLSAWPAAAFIASVELIMLLVREVRAVEAGDTSDDTDTETGRDNDKDNDTDKDNGGGPKGTRGRTGEDPVTVMLRRHPDWDDDKIAARCGVSKRTVARRRKALKEARAGQAAAPD